MGTPPIQKYFFILALLYLISCGQQSSENASEANESGEKINTESTISNSDSTENLSRRTAQKNDLDSIKHMISLWNQALNDHDTKLLESLYADYVHFYKKTVEKDQILKSKKEAFKVDPKYSQSYDELSIQYPSNGYNLVRCVFQKSYTYKGESGEVTAIVDLVKISAEYTITRETDQISEVASIRESKGESLEQENYEFTYDYWLDTREDDAIGHDFIPYTLSIGIDNTYDNKNGFMNWYSGSLRETRNFYVRSVTTKDDLIIFSVAPIFDEEEENPEYTEEDFQEITFKLIRNQLALLDCKNGWFEELEGIRMWRME